MFSSTKEKIEYVVNIITAVSGLIMAIATLIATLK